MKVFYDIEIYPNCFTAAFILEGGLSFIFEISEFKDDRQSLFGFLNYLYTHKYQMVGYNNFWYDGFFINMLINSSCKAGYEQLYQLNQFMFSDAKKPYPSYLIPQIDLYLICHFDNKNKSTRLKDLEFNMQMDNIQDLPFEPGVKLSQSQVSILRKYNLHDVKATCLFYDKIKKEIEFREKLSVTLNMDCINYNSTKIGKQYLLKELRKHGVDTSSQTRRDIIHFSDALLPISFVNQEFTDFYDEFYNMSVKETKGVFNDKTGVTSNGVFFKFGTGGLHASVDNRVYVSNDDYQLVDMDVSSYYPNLAINNDFYPEHLGKKFCEIYKMVYERRKTYPKKSVENAVLKLALNGVYGDTNNPYSKFYDPLFTMKITLNGQFLLLKLSEMVMEIEGLEFVQANTDGVTVYCPKSKLHELTRVTNEWQQMTNLELEFANYKRMFVTNVNSYLAEYEDGKVKRKKEFQYTDLDWNKDFSFLIVPKVAEQHLLHGAKIEDLIYNWKDKYDFAGKVKCSRNTTLYGINPDGSEEKHQSVSRYMVTKGGQKLVKQFPDKRISVHKNNTCEVCNTGLGVLPLDYDFYIQEVEKLCYPLR